MKRLILSLACCLSLLLIFTPVLAAGPIKSSQIPADAKWAAHLDIERLIASQIGQMVIKEAEKEGEMDKVRALGEVFEFDPLKDLHSVTAYGTSFQEEGVVLLKGKFDKKKLLALVRTQTQYEEKEYKGHTVYLVHKEGESGCACFYNPGMIVASNSTELLKKAIMVLDGEIESLADKGQGFKQDGAFMTAGVKSLGELADNGPQARVIQNAEKIHVSVGETEGYCFASGQLYAKNERVAKQVFDILNGIKAMGQLLGAEEPQLAHLAKAVKVRVEENKVSVRISLATEEVLKLLKEAK